jgi:uncharacterized RDD family membrane protein YckC
MTRFSPDMSDPTPATDRDQDETVLAMDNIPLALPVAGIGSRALAATLDYLLVALLATGWIFGLVYAGSRLHSRVGNAWMFAIALLGLFVLEYGYFAGVEAFTGGRSFGKWALSLRVVSRDGGRASVGSLLLRNMVRLLDTLVGVWFMLLDPLSRRLGDRLAGTLVVHTRAQEREVLIGRIPSGWGAREVAVVESLLRRADGMDPARVRVLADGLIACIERDDPSLLAGTPADADPLQRLRDAVAAS